MPAAQPAAKQPQDPIAQRAQETAVTALRQSYNSTMPTSPIGVAAKAAGLRALSRASGAENQQPADAASYLDIARSLFDLLVSGTPGVGLGRDIYEAVSGRNMLSDAELTDTDRLLAVLGVLSASAIDEPLTVVRTLRRIADHKEFFLDKSLTRIRSFSSETVNRFLETKYNYTEPPYRPDARVFRYETTQEERFVRFYTPGQSSKDGPWIMRPGDVEGLSMQDIARKFGLPDGRTHWVDVDVPAGTLLERGPTNKAVFGGDPTVSYQYRLIDPGQVHFGEGMPVKDPFTRK